MRLTTVILIASLMQVSASTFGQRITINQDNASIKSVFREIRKQSGYSFFYDGKIITEHQRVSVKITNVSVDEALNTVLNGLDLTYKIEGKIVSIKKKEQPSFFENLVARFQEIDVFGKVIDESGRPLVGATVKIKGTNRTATTNSEGVFTFREVKEGETLEITYLGYRPKDLKATKNLGVITLEPTIENLEEVKISTGYFESSKLKSTMNITKIDGKDIENQPVTSLMNALSSRVPGLDITPATGKPGTASRVVIRGLNNIRGEVASSPLYVIDGIQIDSEPLSSRGSYSLVGIGFDPLSTLNPGDIESIEVLKDAGATAIYGSKGANGVIRITTKKAKFGGKDNLNFNIYRGAGNLVRKVDLLSREQYLEMRKEAFVNVGVSTPGEFDGSDFGTVWDINRSTDWQETLLGNTANITDFQSSYGGGNEYNNFRVGGSYHKETAIYPGDGFAFQRASANFSFNHLSLDKKLQIGAMVNFGWNKNKGYNDAQFVNLARTLPPVAPKIYNEDGSLNWAEHGYLDGAFVYHTWDNPMANLMDTHDNVGQSLLSNATLSYEIVEGLKFKTLVSYSTLGNEEELKDPLASLAPLSRQGVTAIATFAQNSRQSILAEPQVSFTKTWTRHSVNAMAGFTYQDSRNKSSAQNGSGYVSDALLNSILGAVTVTLNHDQSQYKYASVYTKIGYDYDSRYLFDFTIRRDGSSRFGPNRKLGNFGSIGLGWNFARESFLAENFPVLSHGKLRGSYGITGNDIIGNYQYLNSYSIINRGYQNRVSLTPSSLFNPDFGWEETKKLEIGLELGFLSNRIMIEASRYDNRSSNLLTSVPLSALTGFEQVNANFDAVVQNTGIEASVTSKSIITKNFTWVSSFNFTFPKNKLLKFEGIEGSSYDRYLKIGSPIGLVPLFIYKGVNSQTGEYELEDLNGDGNYNDADMQLKDATARNRYFGINNQFRFGNFEMDFQLQYSTGMSSVSELFSSQPGGQSNQPVEVFNRWQKPGDQTKYAKFTPYSSTLYSYVSGSTVILSQISYLRLKTLSLAWRLPSQFLQKIRSDQARIYLQGQNLFTIGKFSGFDPETGFALPPLKMLTLGLQVNF